MLTPDFSTFPEIETSRLLLRKMILSDGPQIFTLQSNQAVMQYIDRELVLSVPAAEIFINRINDSLKANEGITWAITQKDEPQLLIGTIGFWRLIKEHYRAEVGYMLDPDQQNKGIMKEALLSVVDFGFNKLELHSIEAHINPANKASQKLLLATGFVQEAYFTENFYFNGTFRDTAIFSRLVST